jgi:nucleoside-diphosphate-sugar epimerase
VITKRFAANRQDRRLVERLLRAEDSLEATCAKASIPCRILRPTLIYGQAGDRGDQNLSRLLQMMRRVPFLPLPAETGLRQPIHGRQLAAAALHLADAAARETGAPSSHRITLGGDESLTYTTMLQRLQQAARRRDPLDRAGRCRLLPLPPAVFHLLAAPLLPISAKGFEAVLRIGDEALKLGHSIT